MDKLLKLLEQDALRTPEDLAKILRSTPGEVRRKLEMFRKDGKILGFRAVVNEAMREQDQVKAVIEVRIAPERDGGFDRTAERIAKYAEVSSCHLVSGGYDLLIIVEGKTLQDVASFVASKLATLEKVKSTATHFMLKTYKDQGILMLKPEVGERLAVTP